MTAWALIRRALLFVHVVIVSAVGDSEEWDDEGIGTSSVKMRERLSGLDIAGRVECACTQNGNWAGNAASVLNNFVNEALQWDQLLGLR